MKAYGRCVLAGGLALVGLALWAEPVKVIFDTDMVEDYDDVGALACLHALADAGECEILAMATCTRDNQSVAAVEVINSFYGRGDVPVGCAKELGIVGVPSKDPKRPGHQKYVRLAKEYPDWVRHFNSNDAPDANDVYRKALAAAPDKSVVFISVGFLTNMRRLLETKGDRHSPLDGKALVAQKVKYWAAMACKHPRGSEYNSAKDAESSKIALAEWPTPIYVSDFDYGRNVYAGRDVTERTYPYRNPVKDIFVRCLPSRAATHSPKAWDKEEGGHTAWDETTVLAGARPVERHFNVEHGRFVMTGNGGENVWVPDEKAPGGRLVDKVPKAEIGRILNELIAREPKCRAKGGWPLLTVRHTHVANAPEKFEEIIAANARHPGSVDEYWLCFSAGHEVGKTAEKLAMHGRFRASLEKAGIVIGSQQGVTLGHSEIGTTPGLFPDDAWQVDRAGRRLVRLCPRAPAVLAYEADLVAAAVKAMDLKSVWLDDDLRMGMKKGEGCFCDRCLAAFNAEYGLKLTREELARRLYAPTVKEELRAKWRLFKNKSLAEYAAAARRGADRVNPSVRLAYQSVDALDRESGESYIPLMTALAGGNGRQSAIRVGSGNYFENMSQSYEKMLSVARESERCHRSPVVAQVSYEQEPYTREVLHKSAEAVMIESAMALAAGADALTEYWWVPYRDEPTFYYEEFATLTAEWRLYFEKLSAISKRTSLGGIARYRGADHLMAKLNSLRWQADLDMGSVGIPVTVFDAQQGLYYVCEKTLDELGEGDVATIARLGAVVDAKVWDRFLKLGGEPLAAAVAAGRLVKFDLGLIGQRGVTLPTHAERASLLDAIERVKPLPVRIERSRRLHVFPRVTPEGRVAAVSIVNASLGKCLPTEVKVRGPVAGEVRWYRPNEMPLKLAQRRTGDEVAVTLPTLPGSQIGTLVFE